jgi:hypothetical protein
VDRFRETHCRRLERGQVVRGCVHRRVDDAHTGPVGSEGGLYLQGVQREPTSCHTTCRDGHGVDCSGAGRGDNVDVCCRVIPIQDFSMGSVLRHEQRTQKPNENQQNLTQHDSKPTRTHKRGEHTPGKLNPLTMTKRT